LLPSTLFTGRLIRHPQALLQFFMVLVFLPETKGVSLEELQKRLGVVD